MIPRPYQEEAVNAIRAEIAGGGGTMVSIPTGGGKTAIAGFTLAAERPRKTLVLQHTDELIGQNRNTIADLTGRTTSVVKAERDEWFGDIVFASVQTLGRHARRRNMPAFSHLVIDECHRAPAPSYQAILKDCLAATPDLRYLGLTATPGRGDSKPLRRTFPTCAFRISIGELIEMGALVPPEAYTIDLADDEIASLRAPTGAADFDMGDAAAILNNSVNNDAVVRHWKERADGLRTVAFCSTIQHASDVADAFVAGGVPAEVVSSGTSRDARRAILDRLRTGETRVVCNCMVLTEGFDLQTLGCIVILRPMAHHGTLIQAVGRGLRTVDQRKHPGHIKTKCIVLDFSGALARHGSLEMVLAEETDRKPSDRQPSERGEPVEEIADLFGAPISDFTMREISIIAASPFGWSEVAKGTLVTHGFDAAAFVVRRGSVWYALGKRGARGQIETLTAGDRAHAVAAADDYMREHETSAASSKTRSWMAAPASAKQLDLLQLGPDVPRPGRYEASCRLDWKFNRGRALAAIRGFQ